MFEKYNKTVGGALSEEQFEKIVKLLLEEKVDYEFGTTLVKELHTKEDILGIFKSIKGAKVYYLQRLKNDVGLLSSTQLSPFEEEEVKEIIKEGRKFVNVVYRPLA